MSKDEKKGIFKYTVYKRGQLRAKLSVLIEAVNEITKELNGVPLDDFIIEELHKYRWDYQAGVDYYEALLRDARLNDFLHKPSIKAEPLVIAFKNNNPPVAQLPLSNNKEDDKDD